MEQQPFKRVGQENFTTNPKIQPCWQRGGRGGESKGGIRTIAGRILCAWTVVGAASHLAQIPREAGETQALEAVDLVLAAAAVQTRRARALVDVPLAVFAGEAGRACAPVSVHQVLGGQERHRFKYAPIDAPTGRGPNNNCQTRARVAERG